MLSGLVDHYCSIPQHVLAQIVNLHDETDHVSFGVFIGPNPNPEETTTKDESKKNPVKTSKPVRISTINACLIKV